MTAKTLPAGSMFIDRRDLMHSMMALYVSQLGADRHTRDEPYTAGYREGYANAMLAIAAAVGVIEEFADAAATAARIAERRRRVVEAVK